MDLDFTSMETYSRIKTETCVWIDAVTTYLECSIYQKQGGGVREIDYYCFIA